jgi:MFS family permease
MHLDILSNRTQLIGAINGLFQAGGLIGTFTSSNLADRLGRKKAILIACPFFILGGALQAGSVALAMYIVARFITSFGIGK